MKIQVLGNSDAMARQAARIIAAEALAAVAARDRFVMAVSGGHTPWQMLRTLADESVPWKNVHVVQVDERVAPAGDPDRISRTCGKACLNTPRCRPNKSMPCQWKKRIWKPPLRAMPGSSNKLPVLLRCWTLLIWAWTGWTHGLACAG